MAMDWSSPMTAIKGVGEKRAMLYRRLGIESVGQLVLHLPRDYIDLRVVADLAACVPGEKSLVRVLIVKKTGEQRIRKGLSLFPVEAEADGVRLTITFYNSRYAADAMRIGEEYLLYGEVGGSLLRRTMASPMVLDARRAGELFPIYGACAGLSSRMIERDVQAALGSLTAIAETLPARVVSAAGLPSLDWAVRTAHHPASQEESERARERVVFEELLVFSTAMLRLRGVRDQRRVAPMQAVSLEVFHRALPFSLTQGQRDAVAAIAKDLCSGRVMNRLVQGDVGSGKTVVAAAAVFLAHQNGVQSALMAPTELLAEQHVKTMTGFLAPLGLRVALLTGSTRAAERRQIEAALLSGEIAVVVGTHALLTESTRFSRLGLVITDEQHRFGVGQRAALAAKGEAVHTLVMSATPIPRTLSLILYGDLDLSLIRELPPGRRPVETYCIDPTRRQRAYGFIKEQLAAGRQAYAVCPLIEEGEEEQSQALVSAVDYHQKLAKGAFSEYRLGLLHGKMHASQKEQVMAQFATGEIDLLVSTTVVEVGVDVPNAAVMLIENAERFGLSQLHQLRGRVGRGNHASYCILVTDAKGQTTAERLAVIKRSGDGFYIAEEDLRLRGPGDLLGARQHGIPGLSGAELASNPALFEQAQQAAVLLLREDPRLEQVQNKAIAQGVARLCMQVGERPN